MAILKIIMFLIIIGLERTCFLTHWLNPLMAWLRIGFCLPTQLAFELNSLFNMKMRGVNIQWFSDRHLKQFKDGKNE